MFRQRLFFIVVALAMVAVSWNVRADLVKLNDPAVSITGDLGSTWDGSDNKWEILPGPEWVWNPDPALMTQYNELNGNNPVTVGLALGNGTYDLGFKWYEHGFSYDVTVGLSVEGITANQAMTVTGGGGKPIQHIGTFTVTDGAATLVFGEVTGKTTGEWFSIGALDVSFTPAPAPEPSALVLVATGVLGLAAYAWRKRR